MRKFQGDNHRRVQQNGTQRTCRQLNWDENGLEVGVGMGSGVGLFVLQNGKTISIISSVLRGQQTGAALSNARQLSSSRVKSSHDDKKLRMRLPKSVSSSEAIISCGARVAEVAGVVVGVGGATGQ